MEDKENRSYKFILIFFGLLITGILYVGLIVLPENARKRGLEQQKEFKLREEENKLKEVEAEKRKESSNQLQYNNCIRRVGITQQEREMTKEERIAHCANKYLK